MNEPYVSLVIPAYNESARIARSINDLKSFFKSFGASVEIIFVIEKSSDGTLELVKKATEGDPQFVVIGNDVQRGKGFAVRTGMLQARGRIVIFMDADLSTPLVEVVSFLNHFESHPETQVAIGSRQHAQSQIIRRQHPLRQKMGQTFNVLVQLLAVPGIKDTQCGFKAFRAEAVKPIFSRQKLEQFSFDVEILLLAQALGYKIDVLPVKWANAPGSKVHIVSDSIKMFIDVLRVRRLVRKTLKSLPPGTEVK